MTPTLIVPGPAEDWLPTAIVASPFIANVHEPKLCWVPVTTLPAVPSDEWVSEDRGGGYSEIVAEPRPLRAGDTVELATWGLTNSEPPEYLPGVPFATAEVAEVIKIEWNQTWDGETFPALCRTNDGVVFLRTARGEPCPELPGNWTDARYGVRLTNVEALPGHVDSAVTPEEAQALRVESINERHARLRAPRH